jgi:hypothetical protein
MRYVMGYAIFDRSCGWGGWGGYRGLGIVMAAYEGPA